MKKSVILLLTVPFLLMLTGCKLNYPVAQESGKEDIAYLLFVSPKYYAKKNVDVRIDNNTFQAKVVKERNSKRKGTAYAVSTGRKTINVESNGKILYKKDIFLSPQETKIITLP